MQAQISIEAAVEGCKSIIRQEETPGFISKNYENLVVVLLSVIVGALFIITLYLVYKRVKYSLEEEE